MEEPQKPNFSGLKVDTKLNTKAYLYNWEEIRTPPPYPSRRSYHSAGVWRNKLIIVGGQDLREGPQSGIWCLTVSQHSRETWEMLPAPDIGPIYRSSVIVHKDSLYLFGGTNGDAEFNLMRILSLKTLKWTNVSPETANCPPALDSHTACLYEQGSSVVVFGGYIAGNRTNNVYLFDLHTNKWTRPVISEGPCARSNHSAVVYDNFLVIFGGADAEGEKLSDCWKLNLQSMEWERIEGTGRAPSGRSGHSATMYKNMMILFGGMKDITQETNEMFSFNFESNDWVMFQAEHQIKDPITAEQIEEYKKSKSPTRLPRNSSPNGAAFRRSFTTVNDKSPTKLTPQRPSIKMEGTGDLSPAKRKKTTGGLYDGPPAPIVGRVRGSAPHPRDGHSAVMIEENLVIFGGDRHQMPFNDTYSYTLRDEVIRTNHSN